MAVTVKKISWSSFNFSRSGDIFTLNEDMDIKLNIVHNDTEKTIVLKYKKNFKCDGLSVPKKFQKILPRWKSNNKKYCLSSVVHDALYYNKGFGVFNRSEADDFFRGILRMSGVSRLVCSTADLALDWFGSEHWGEDKLSSKTLVSIE